MNPFSQLRAYLQLRTAIKKADKAHKSNGQRYYVVGTTHNGERRLYIMDRKNFRKLKFKRYITTNAKVFDLIIESFYFTPYANGTGQLSPEWRKKKLKQYFDWCEAIDKASKQKGRKA